MHYKAPDNSLHFLGDDSFVHLLPEGSIAITDVEAEAIRIAATTPTHAALVATVLATARDLRTKLFAVVDGLQASALATGNTADALSIETFKTGIRNITLIDLSGATTLVQMQAIITAQYKVLAAAAPLSVQLAFRQALQ